ncbi:hypothetical protein ANO11243_001050 [Dothideomycetidae sp. 11243]|nr:hypothetical protein ANO11243_001050 [fungal sp. No.11243]
MATPGDATIQPDRVSEHRWMGGTLRDVRVRLYPLADMFQFTTLKKSLLVTIKGAARAPFTLQSFHRFVMAFEETKLDCDSVLGPILEDFMKVQTRKLVRTLKPEEQEELVEKLPRVLPFILEAAFEMNKHTDTIKTYRCCSPKCKLEFPVLNSQGKPKACPLCAARDEPSFVRLGL